MGWVKGSAAWPIASEIKSRTTGFFSSRRRHTRYWRDWSLDVCSSDLKADLCRRYPNSARLGRHSTPVEVILRMLVVKRHYNFSYEQTEHFVSDSIVLRQFCRLYLEPVPDDTALIRWANTIGPETVASLNDQAVELARSSSVRTLGLASEKWRSYRHPTRGRAATTLTTTASRTTKLFYRASVNNTEKKVL